MRGRRTPGSVLRTRVLARDMQVREAAYVFHKLPEILPKLEANKGIEHRIQAGTQVGNCLCHCDGVVEAGHGVILPARATDELYEVEGHLGQQEHRHHQEDDLQRLVLPEASSLKQGLDDDRVAHNHGKQWQEEPQGHLDGQHHGGNLLLITADGLVMVKDIAVDDLRQGNQQGNDPDGQADGLTPGHVLGPLVVGLGGPYHSNEAVHGDAGEDEHGCVEVQCVDTQQDFAHDIAKDPLMGACVGPEGQSADEHQVSQGQVHQEHIRRALQLLVEDIDDQHQGVPHQATVEHHHIHARQEELAEPQEVLVPLFAVIGTVEEPEVFVVVLSHVVCSAGPLGVKPQELHAFGLRVTPPVFPLSHCPHSGGKYACMHAKSLQSFPTLCDPVDLSPPGSSVHGIL